jgi:hypothetical protein
MEDLRSEIVETHIKALGNLADRLEEREDAWLQGEAHLAKLKTEIMLKEIRIDVLDELSSNEEQLNRYLDMTNSAREEYLNDLIEKRYNNIV